MPRSDEDSESDSYYRRKRRKHNKSSREHRERKKHRKKKHHRKQKSRDNEDSYSSSAAQEDNSSVNNSISSDDSYDRRKQKKSHRRKSERRDKSRRRDSKRPRRESQQEEDSDDNNDGNEYDSKKFGLAEALFATLSQHPALAADLPIMLVRLANGATFDLSQMTDQSAAHGLATVFASLKDYGVEKDKNSWKLNTALNGLLRNSTNELMLVRAVKAILDDVGFTVRAVADFERKTKEFMEQQQQLQVQRRTQTEDENKKKEKVTTLVQQLFDTFKDASFRDELARLCQTIMEGESVSTNDLPNEDVKNALEGLFGVIGLEKSEMECGSSFNHGDKNDNTNNNDNSDVAREKVVVLGYGIPDAQRDSISTVLESVIDTCRNNGTSASTRAIKGPRLPHEYADHELIDSDDDVGPAVIGAVRISQKLTSDAIKAQAEKRSRELASVASGRGIVVEGAREEWMLVPGKFDFMNAIKSGQPTKSRQFENKKTAGRNVGGTTEKQQTPQSIDPQVQEELDRIMKMHNDARGPSLMDEHRRIKAAEAAQKASSGDKSWSWSRDKNLDDGRRVDKDALRTVLGTAAESLKSKFKGGYSGM